MEKMTKEEWKFFRENFEVDMFDSKIKDLEMAVEVVRKIKQLEP